MAHVSLAYFPSLPIHTCLFIKIFLSSSCYLCLENRLYRCALRDETNKIRPHLHMFWRCLWNCSNFFGNLLSFCSNLCVFRLIGVTTYVHNNFYFVSTYIYECMVDFVCSIYILYVQQIMCITNFVFSNFSLNVWQFLFYGNLYMNLCVRQLTSLFNTYVYDILYLWQLMYMTDSIFRTTYAYNKLCFLWQFCFYDNL